MSLLAQVQAANLEWQRKLDHEGQDEQASISLLKRDALTNELTAFATITEGWSYSDRDVDGRALPPRVQYELQIAEELITREQVNQTAGIQHGSQRFMIVVLDPSEPGISKPAGPRRFWRFWIASLEEGFVVAQGM